MISLKQMFQGLVVGGWAVMATAGLSFGQEDGPEFPAARPNTSSEWRPRGSSSRPAVATTPSYQATPQYVPDTYPADEPARPVVRQSAAPQSRTQQPATRQPAYRQAAVPQSRRVSRGMAQPAAYQAEPDMLTQDLLPAPGPDGQMRNGGAAGRVPAKPVPAAPQSDLAPQPDTAQLAPAPMVGGDEMPGYEPGFEGAGCGSRCRSRCDDGFAHGGATWCGNGVCCEQDLAPLRNFAVFAGVQAFKGPLDLGTNSNFGVHEGFLWGGPFGGILDSTGPREIGWEIGLQGVHSDFNGDRALAAYRPDGRNQLFFTTGVFRRPPCGGLQWGLVYDYMQDELYSNNGFSQIRADVALVGDEGNDIGFSGAFSLNHQDVNTVDTAIINNGTVVQVTPVVRRARSLDMYCGYYRRHFQEGAEARIYAGVTNASDGIVGFDFRLPISRSWALENTLHYQIPSEGTSVTGQARESWNMGISLVWYPGRSAQCIMQSPYRPLLPVADNGSFIVDPKASFRVDPNAVP